MKKCIKKICFFILVVSTFLPPWSSVQAKTLPSGISEQDIGQEIESYVQDHEKTTAGLAVAVFNDKEIIYENYFGYQDLEAQVPVNQDTVFEWGSITKLSVWVSLMQLKEEGLVDFDTDIKEYLPEGFLGDLRYDKPITVTDLFNHSAGFQDIIVGIFSPDDEPILTLAEELKRTQPAQIYEPGQYHGYSNWSTALAGYIVEYMSGESFADYVHEHIFQALNMERTAILPDLSDNESVKAKRKELKTYSNGNQLLDGTATQIALYPAGMATGSLSDLVAFGQGLMNENSPLFNDPNTLREMHRPTKTYGDSNLILNAHGLWGPIYGAQTLGHSGNTVGCSSSFLFDSESKIGLVVMTNQGNETIYNMGLMELVFGDVADSEYADLIPPKKLSLYESMRNIKTGPFKFYNLFSYRIGQSDIFDFWTNEEKGDATVIDQPYWNLVKVPTLEGIFIGILVLAFIIGLLFAIIGLAASLISLLRKPKNKTDHNSLRNQHILILVLMLAVVINFIFVITGVLSYQASSYFVKYYVLFAILALLLLVLGIRLFIKTKQDQNPKKLIYYASSVFALIYTLFISYYELYAFWAL